MTNRSMTSDLAVASHIGGTVATTQTPSNGVDLQGAFAAEVLAYIGTVTNIANSPQPSWTLTLQHSDTSNSGFAAVADSDVVLEDGGSIASGVFATVDDAAEDDAWFRIGYVGGKRYIRVVATAANTPGNTPVAVCVVKRLALVA